jgi:hypothetical protein
MSLIREKKTPGANGLSLGVELRAGAGRIGKAPNTTPVEEGNYIPSIFMMSYPK